MTTAMMLLAVSLAAAPEQGPTTTPAQGQAEPPPQGQAQPPAQGEAQPPAQGEAQPPPEGQPPPAGQSPSDMGFDLFGPATPPPPDALSPYVARQAERRRTMLTLHQTFGIGTLVTMAATTVIGALNYHDLYGGGSGSGSYLWPHRILVGVTTLEFATAGFLAAFAPKPYAGEVSDRGFSTATVHKTATALATLGMLTQIGVGFVAARRAEAGNPRDRQTLARIHEVVGYTTMGLLVVAASAWVF